MSRHTLFATVTVVLTLAVIRGVIAAWMYAANKYHVNDFGADDDLGVVAVQAHYDSTNDLTHVRVSFTNSAVTTDTPVHVRNFEASPWTLLEKLMATVTVDMPTNYLDFAVSGNEDGRLHWWVGNDTPAVIIESTGILVTQFEARSHYVLIAWSCDDPRVTMYEVQMRLKGDGDWSTVAETADTLHVHYGFYLDRNTEWRVISTIGGL